MLSRDKYHGYINGPAEVNFAGLQGTTYSMQQEGWQLAIEEDITPHFEKRVRLTGHHPTMNLKILSMPAVMSLHSMMESLMGERAYTANNEDIFKRRNGDFPMIAFNVFICTQELMFHCYEKPNFQAVDFSRPMLDEFTPEQIFNFNDFSFFKPLNPNVDVYVPKDEIWTVEKHLQEVVNMQQDRQKELREKARRKRRATARERENEVMFDREDNEKGEVKLQLVAV